MRIHVQRKPWILLVLVILLIWIMNMTLTSYNPEYRSSNQIKEEILQLSEAYVRQMARESRDTLDGPFAARFTGYDLKKTMAVILEDMMSRIQTLEKEVKHLKENSSLPRGPLLTGRKDNFAWDIPVEGVLGREKIKSAENIESPIDMKQLSVEKSPGQDSAPRGLILGAQEDCSLTPEQQHRHPHCGGKMAWMSDHWKSDPCYAEYGVDGSQCSIRVYLSEVENWCPLIEGRTRPPPVTRGAEPAEKAVMRFDLKGLFDLLHNPGDRPNYDWIRNRIQNMWPNWVEAGQRLQAKLNSTQAPPRKKVLVHLGLLSRKSGFKMAENSLKGGPLGELVQWSDIICTLYMLGHNLTITSEFEELAGTTIGLSGPAAGSRTSCKIRYPNIGPSLIITDLVGWKQFRRKYMRYVPHLRKLDRLPTAESQCQNRERLPMDMVFSDIVGLTQFKRKVKAGYGKFSCLLRIIDSFGTEPAFNYDVFAKANRLKTQWGMQNLNPQQFFTMFPHSPDNSFMGFVVENHLNDTEKDRIVTRKNQAVVYGKAEYMWAGKESYIEIFKDYVEIHGTVFTESAASSLVPSYVRNHGIMPGNQLHQLLRESKIFIGLGFPYEGPAPLEAMALGNVFINPRFSPPHNSQNTKFFADKPTRRKVTSQHPYAEDFVGEPHVITVDIEDTNKLRSVIKQALDDIDSGKVQPYLPFEYTQEGMLQRVSYYITKQDFCVNNAEPWIPEHAVTLEAANKGESCRDACFRKNRICEPSHFQRLNSANMLEKLLGVKCELQLRNEHILYPAYRVDLDQCVLQQEPMLFSCVGEDRVFQRICPCRTFMAGQTAICDGCLTS